MSVSMNEVHTPYAAHFELHTAKLSQNDACLSWLKKNYSRDDIIEGDGRTKETPNSSNGNNKSTDTGIFLSRMENDLSACAAHRWAHFSQRSPVYEATSPHMDNYLSNTTEAHVQQFKGEEGEGVENNNKNVFIVAVQNPHHKHDASTHADPMLVEPSRHIFIEAVRKRNARDVAMKVEASGRSCNVKNAPRPFFGGYFVPPPHSFGPTRFLVFPQWMHDAHIGSTQPQELSYFVRGTIGQKSSKHMRSDDVIQQQEEERGLLHKFIKSIIFNVSFSQKFTATTSRWYLFKNVDAMRVDMYANNENTERSFLPRSSKKKSRRKPHKDKNNNNGNSNNVKPLTFHFRDSGVRASFFLRNPRYSLTLDNAYRVAQSLSNKSGDQHTIASFTILDAYDSAVQRFTTSFLHRLFPRAHYHLQWSAGPGVEYVTMDKPWTTFGKLNTEWWVEFPFFKRVVLCIRNQSSLVQPLSLLGREEQTETRSHDINRSKTSSDNTNNSNGDGVTHSLFWATQGPRWDASLVRGFKDDYASMHYANRWYTLLSAELASSKDRREGGSKSSRVPNWMLYANACFVDSFARAPRASVGFAFSGPPRGTIDAFNALKPFSFECSFNWMLKFGQERLSLVSGLAGGQRAEESSLRLSPVETFRHLRCGLTWKA